MNKKILISILCLVILVGVIVGVIFLTKGNSNNENTKNSSTTNTTTSSASTTTSIKDDKEDAEYQIKVAMQKLLEETYGKEVIDARIYVEKIYTEEDEKNDEMLKSYNIGKDEVAFSVKYELKPAEGVDTNKFTAGTGKYDESTGWITEKYNVGILKPDGNSYKITNFGTSF